MFHRILWESTCIEDHILKYARRSGDSNLLSLTRESRSLFEGLERSESSMVLMKALTVERRSNGSSTFE